MPSNWCGDGMEGREEERDGEMTSIEHCDGVFVLVIFL